MGKKSLDPFSLINAVQFIVIFCQGSCNQDTTKLKLLSGVYVGYYFVSDFRSCEADVYSSVPFSCTTTPPPPPPPLSSTATTPAVANGCAPSFLFFSSALHIKAAESQQTGDDVLKVLPAIQLWSALHLCAATITGFAQRCVCGVSTAGSVLVHGGSFLKSLTPCRGNAAPWELLMILNLLASP